MPAPPPSAARRRPPLTDPLFDLVRDLPGLFTDRIELLLLELQRANLALRQIVVVGVAATVFAGTAWLAFWAVLVALLVEAGAHWSWALGAALIGNLLAAAVAGWRVARMLPLLTLPATRRHLAPHLDAPSPAPPHDLDDSGPARAVTP